MSNKTITVIIVRILPCGNGDGVESVTQEHHLSYPCSRRRRTLYATAKTRPLSPYCRSTPSALYRVKPPPY